MSLQARMFRIGEFLLIVAGGLASNGGMPLAEGPDLGTAPASCRRGKVTRH